MWRLFVAALALAGLLTGYSLLAADDDAAGVQMRYVLQYKFKAGEVVRAEVVHRATIKTTIEGTTQTNDNQSKSVKVWQVKEVTRGKITFTHLIESLDMWQKTQGRSEVRYNSESEDEVPPGYEEAAKSVGVPLTVATMDEHGNISKRQDKRPQQASMTTQLTVPLPDEPIAVGQNWSSPLDIDLATKDGVVKKVKTRQLFTLEKVEGDIATIEVDTQILTPVTDPTMKVELIQRLSKGTVKFDIAAGRVISQQLDLDEHVVGFNGPASSMHYVMRYTERMVDDGPQTARRAPLRSQPIEAK